MISQKNTDAQCVESSEPVWENHTGKPALPFDCSMCGECCTSVTIPIHHDKVAYLLSRPWVQKRFDETGLSFTPLDNTHDQLPLTYQRTCVFLSDDKGCMIHANEGESAKPTECQRFPFATLHRNTANTFSADASASCKHIAEHMLSSCQPIIPNAQYSIQPHEETLPTKIPVHRWRSIPQSELAHYYEQLAHIYDKPTALLNINLRKAYRLLQGHTTTEAHHGKLSARWEQFLRFRFLRRPYGSLSQWALLTQNNYYDPKIVGDVSIHLKPQTQIQWPDSPELYPTFNGFLYSLLRRQVLLAFGHSLSSVFLLTITGKALVEWYARTFALIGNRTVITSADLVLAIRITERYYTGHQPYFLERIRRSPFTPEFLAILFR